MAVSHHEQYFLRPATETDLYHGTIPLQSTTDGTTFVLTSGIVTNSVGGCEVERQFTLSGDMLEAGFLCDVLSRPGRFSETCQALSFPVREL